MLIHTAIKNGNIPPVRGVEGLPGAMSGCGATCTSRGLPGVVGISGRSEVARWKATITAVIFVYLDWTKTRSPIGEAMDVIGHTGDEESDYSFEDVHEDDMRWNPNNDGINFNP